MDWWHLLLSITSPSSLVCKADTDERIFECMLRIGQSSISSCHPISPSEPTCSRDLRVHAHLQLYSLCRVPVKVKALFCWFVKTKSSVCVKEHEHSKPSSKWNKCNQMSQLVPVKTGSRPFCFPLLPWWGHFLWQRLRGTERNLMWKNKWLLNEYWNQLKLFILHQDFLIK